MKIQRANFEVGMGQSTNDEDDVVLAVKIEIFGLDTMETAKSVCARVSATLMEMEPQLKLDILKDSDAPLN